MNFPEISQVPAQTAQPLNSEWTSRHLADLERWNCAVISASRGSILLLLLLFLLHTDLVSYSLFPAQPSDRGLPPFQVRSLVGRRRPSGGRSKRPTSFAVVGKTCARLQLHSHGQHDCLCVWQSLQKSARLQGAQGRLRQSQRRVAQWPSCHRRSSRRGRSHSAAFARCATIDVGSRPRHRRAASSSLDHRGALHSHARLPPRA